MRRLFLCLFTLTLLLPACRWLDRSKATSTDAPVTPIATTTDAADAPEQTAAPSSPTEAIAESAATPGPDPSDMPLRSDPFQVSLEPLLDGIWVVQRPQPERQPVMGNGLVIVNEDHVVVVDGNGSPLLADRTIEKISELTPLPVRTLVLTSWHGDHHLGSHRYRARWPELELVSHRFTRDAMLGAPMRYLDDLRESLPEQMSALNAMAAAGRTPDGKPLPAYMKTDFDDLLRFSDLILAELDASQISPPDRVFDDRLVLESTTRRIELLHFGPGNTAGDTLVWLPEERVLAAGDVIVAPTPFGAGSYPRSWVQVLERIRGLQPRYILPGHGAVQDNPYYLMQLQTLLERIALEAETAVTSGQNLEQFQQAFDWEGTPIRFHGNDPVLALRWAQWFAAPVLEAAHNEARGVENEPLWVPGGD